MISKKAKTFSFSASIFFIGIGGIGISALAKLALYQGVKVSGTDLVKSEITDDLKKQKAKITIAKNNNFLISQFLNFSPDLVIYSTAVPFDNSILIQARRLKIPTKSYPQILGKISQSYFTIAVSGMHGKSTTTAMIGLMLESAGLDPLVIVGTKVKEWGGNIRINQKLKVSPAKNFFKNSGGQENQPRKLSGQNLKFKNKKNIFVVEADEYKSAMLNLSPNIIVLTRVEEDHLDYFRNIDHIKREFRKYLKKLPSDSCAIVNWKDKNIQSIVKLLNCSIVKYNIINNSQIIKKIKKILKIPGQHNLENALAAYKVGERMGLTEKQILIGLSKFKGTWRRLELIGKLQVASYKLQVISDYAHHPTEIKATLQALREKYPKKRILLAYQPHQHNRTKMLFNDFVNAFDQADVLILNEIFDVAGREADLDQNVSSKDLVREIKKRIKLNCSIVKLLNCYYAETVDKTKKKILQLAKPNDIIVIMGAGDIDKVARELVKS